MILHTIVWTFDTAMVGRLNKEAITAVNLAGQIIFGVVTILGGAIGVGVASLVSRNIGAGEHRKATHVVAQGFIASIITGIVLTVIGVGYSDKILSMIVEDKEVIRLGTQYLNYVMIGVFFNLPLYISNSALRGAGNTTIPLLSALVADVFNLVGDYVLIFGKFGFPRLEVKGAAIATSIALFLACMVSLFFLIKGKGGFIFKARDFKLRVKSIKELVTLSIPACMENFMNEGSRMVSSFWIAKLGTLSFAAHSIAVAAESISYMPGYGFSVAATTLVGQSIGRKKIEEAEASAKRSTIFSVILMSFVGLIFFTIPQYISMLFTNEGDVIKLSAECLRVGAFEQPTIAISMVLSGALKGAGDTKGPFYASMVSNTFVRLPLIFLIVFVFKLSIVYVWVVTAIQFLVESILMYCRYRKNNWKEAVR